MSGCGVRYCPRAAQQNKHLIQLQEHVQTGIRQGARLLLEVLDQQRRALLHAPLAQNGPQTVHNPASPQFPCHHPCAYWGTCPSYDAPSTTRSRTANRPKSAAPLYSPSGTMTVAQDPADPAICATASTSYEHSQRSCGLGLTLKLEPIRAVPEGQQLKQKQTLEPHKGGCRDGRACDTSADTHML